MPLIHLTCEVPLEIARGLADGSYRIGGAVIQNNQGRVVRWLSPALASATRSLRNPRIVIGAVIVVAALGSTIYLYGRFSRKARLANKLVKVDKAIQLAAIEHGAEFTRDDLRSILDTVDEFLQTTENAAYRNIRLTLPADAHATLLAFANALQSFSNRLESLSGAKEEVPGISVASDLPDLVLLLKSIKQQLAFQQKYWPPDSAQA